MAESDERRPRLPDNVIRTKCSPDEFYDLWMTFTAPYHRLTRRESEVAAIMLRHRAALLRRFGSADMADRVLCSRAERDAMREESGLERSHFNVVMSKFRSAGFLKGGRIEPRFIPSTGPGDGMVVLQIIFVTGEAAG